ncbi:MAG: co-chaperone GroES [Candidatus Colwellbacteria bacterium]|nr:co-chaperone GroES [Candidatus Colwellbacteria bacterium]
MQLKPLSNHIFLEPSPEEKTTKSGIVIPDTADKERPIRGKVVAAGPGKFSDKGERIQMSVKVGDEVLFKKYGMDEIEVSGKKYLVGDEDDILAIIGQ